MRTTGRAVLTVLLLTTFVWVAPGCTENTSCKRMKARFDTCAEPLWDTLEPQLKGRATDTWRASKNVQHFQYCQRIKGRYKQSAKINRCLKEQGCSKFAQCFCQAVKKKGCGRL
jgi:hypothetical protein